MLTGVLTRQTGRSQGGSPDLVARDRPDVVELAVVLYCAWQSRDLVIAWQQSSVDRLGWLALSIWCLPALAQWCVPSRRRETERLRVTLLGLALLCGVLGELGDVNTVQHVGLALALAGIAWRGKRTIPWLLGAISWMPLLAWLAEGTAPADLVPLRLGLALLATGWMLLGSRYRWRGKS